MTAITLGNAGNRARYVGRSRNSLKGSEGRQTSLSGVVPSA